MNQFSALLNSAAAEARIYQPKPEHSDNLDQAWFELIAVRLENASRLNETDSVLLEIKTIARMVIDSGPLESDFIPSFFSALHASQHLIKHKQKHQPSHA